MPPVDPPDAELFGTVLYIEDNPTNVALVEGLMARYPNVAFLHAGSGEAGVAEVRRSRPDFVLLDMHLPDMSGLEVVRRLNEDIALRGLRVTILTGDRLTMDIIKAMSLGAWEYWPKPLDAQVLATGLQRALSGRQADPEHTINTSPGALWTEDADSD